MDFQIGANHGQQFRFQTAMIFALDKQAGTISRPRSTPGHCKRNQYALFI